MPGNIPSSKSVPRKASYKHAVEILLGLFFKSSKLRETLKVFN